MLPRASSRSIQRTSDDTTRCGGNKEQRTKGFFFWPICRDGMFLANTTPSSSGSVTKKGMSWKNRTNRWTKRRSGWPSKQSDQEPTSKDLTANVNLKREGETIQNESGSSIKAVTLKIHKWVIGENGFDGYCQLLGALRQQFRHFLLLPADKKQHIKVLNPSIL